MSQEQSKLKHLINETSEILNLEDRSVIEKDFYLTQALHIISDINNPYFTLVFHGGTALAKAHKIVERMSEDCDFRIHASPKFLALNNSQRRNALRSYRHEMLDYLKETGFSIPDEGVKVRDEGHYFTFNLQYSSLYPANEILRPHIQLEFMAVNSRLPTIERPVTTLIRQTLGESIDHKIKTLTCVSVNETAAEKWVALTRRVANAMRCPDRFPDPTLVRHIYDLYCIEQKQGINQTSYSLIDELVKEDAIRYKNQNINYVQDPVSEIKWSLSLLTENKDWAKNWDNFMQSMVYSETKPDYKIALGHLAKITQPILDQLSTIPKAVIPSWFHEIPPIELKILKNHADPTIKKLGHYLNLLQKPSNEAENYQTKELFNLLAKAIVKDPILSPLLKGSAPIFSEKLNNNLLRSKEQAHSVTK